VTSTEQRILAGAISGLVSESIRHREAAAELYRQLGNQRLPSEVRRRLARRYHAAQREAKAAREAAEYLRADLP
jgi:hypothetical protein